MRGAGGQEFHSVASHALMGSKRSRFFSFGDHYLGVIACKLTRVFEIPEPLCRVHLSWSWDKQIAI